MNPGQLVKLPHLDTVGVCVGTNRWNEDVVAFFDDDGQVELSYGPFIEGLHVIQSAPRPSLGESLSIVMASTNG